MAPKKRSGKQQDPEKPELQARVTRSSAKRAASAGSAESEPELPKKKTKEAAKKEEEHEEKKTVEIDQPEPELPKKKAKKAEKKEEEQEEINSEPNGKTIVIEHCKQCNSFKTRAIQVKEGLEKSVAGITVLVNPDKEMKRPFKPMKALDMEKVISDIVDGIK
ncbi:FK506-binding protein 4 isoform X2 [Alnus glutinosa]|uniref:FK506-binding protein 4 isoform X2 n=1 Tax=Alnus glutinosa TaxID=3517 RepID=UPI002D77B918|nr:FK506-binding protein 4 isoform X2 [Alnus glutinosa]